MPNTVTSPDRRSGPSSRSHSSGNGGARKWSREPHHRRRRLLAGLSLLLLLVVLILIAAGSGGSSPPPVAVHTAGLLSRIQTLAGNGPTSFAGVENASQNAAINRTLAYTPAIRVAGSQHREIALTFDDGPGPYTPQVVSVLVRMHVPATFFEVGVAEQYFHQGTSEIVDHDLTIGDHTFNHLPMSELSEADQQSQLLEQTKTIGQYGAPFPRLFRPPYGLWNSTTLALLHRYHMLMVMWTVDTSDYTRPGTAAIIRSVLDGARPGAIILMHDAGGDRSETVAALPTIVNDLRARGFKLVSVPQLILDNPPPANQDIASIAGGGG